MKITKKISFNQAWVWVALISSVSMDMARSQGDSAASDHSQSLQNHSENYEKEMEKALSQNFLTVFPDQGHQDPSLSFPYVNTQAPKKGNITFGGAGSFNTFDPFNIQMQCAAGIDSLMYVTLFKGSPEEASVRYPYLAESVKILSGKEGAPKVVEFLIREGALFHDGTPITAEDVKFSFDHLRKSLSVFRGYYHAVDKAIAVDSRRIRFILKEGAAKEVPLILSELTVFSKKFFTNSNLTKEPLKIPLGNGPYKIEKFQAGNSIRYARVKDWWGENLPVNKGFYNFDTITYQYFQTEEVVFEAFKKGIVDVFTETVANRWVKGYDFPAVKEGRIKKEEIDVKGATGHPGFIFNTRRPLFRDLRVRKALSLMLDFQALNKDLFNNSYTRVTSLFNNTQAQAKGLPSEAEMTIIASLKHPVPEEIKTTPAEEFTLFKLGSSKADLHVSKSTSNTPSTDPKNPQESEDKLGIDERRRQALELLSQAGWTLKKGVLTHKDGRPFHFSILANGHIFDKVFQRLKASLASIGITMTIDMIDTMNHAQFVKKIKSFSFDMTYGAFSVSGDIPGNELTSYLGSQAADDPKFSHNLAGVKNPLVDELIHKILQCQT